MSKSEKVFNAGEEERTEEEAVQSQGKALETAFLEFAAACEAVKGKKRAIYERYEELNRKMSGAGLERVEIRNENPFDVNALKAAAIETGSPTEAKEWIAMMKGAAASVYLDADFFAACMKVVEQCGKIAGKEDSRMSAELAQLEAERDRVVKEMDKKISAARRALGDYRSMISENVVLKADEANRYLTENLPHCFCGESVGKSVGIVSGPGVPVTDQLNTFLRAIAAQTRKPQRNPYAHLEALGGKRAAGSTKEMTVVPEPSASDQKGRRSFFDFLKRR